ncbi:MAG: hypothetical protein WAZ77_01370 [Candidatus Nitrosopolaris sp.]
MKDQGKAWLVPPYDDTAWGVTSQQDIAWMAPGNIIPLRQGMMQWLHYQTNSRVYFRGYLIYSRNNTCYGHFQRHQTTKRNIYLSVGFEIN